MDAYVFVRSADAAVVQKLQKLAKSGRAGIRFAAGISGPYDAIAALDVPDFAGAQAAVVEIVKAGASGTETSFALPTGVIGMNAPKWLPPMAYESFSQTWVQPGQAMTVLQALSTVPGVMGAAVVAGSYDVLIESGADTFEDLQKILLRVHSVPGIASTQTSFAYLGS